MQEYYEIGLLIFAGAFWVWLTAWSVATVWGWLENLTGGDGHDG